MWVIVTQGGEKELSKEQNNQTNKNMLKSDVVVLTTIVLTT
jgi:hypothetical protein